MDSRANTDVRTSWQESRRRMLAETSRFIEWGLAHPEEVIEIPAKPAGQGGFPRQVAEWFWSVVLTSREDTRVRRWRRMLLERPRGLLRRAGQRVGRPGHLVGRRW